MIFDIHTHIIPNVDDGSSSLSESLKLLSELNRQGVQAVVATPHFYAKYQNLDDCISNATEAFGELVTASSGMSCPEMFLGYEVRYFKNMADNENVKRLSIGNTNYILIELPYDDISDSMIDEIEMMSYNFNLIPVIAHVDRYFGFHGFSRLLKYFAEGDFLAQVNADSIIIGANKKNALSLFKNRQVHFIGSDTHSIAERPPHIKEALKRIEKKFDKQYINKIFINSEMLYKQLKK